MRRGKIMGLFKKTKDMLMSITNNITETTTSVESERYFTFAKKSWQNYNRYVLDEIDVHELGDSTKIMFFYTKANLSQYPQNALVYRNCYNYFWSQVAETRKFKATSSNLVRNISTTLTNIVSNPDIYTRDETTQALLTKILEENDFIDKLYYKQKYKTLVQGWGAYRIDIDSVRNSYPKIRYFNAHNSFFIKEEDDIVAIGYHSHFRDAKDKKYLLIEIRYVKWVDNIPYSCVDKKCFMEDNIEKEIPLKDCDFLKDKNEHIEFANVPFILGEPCVFYELEGLENEGMYGRSAFYGKIDALDDYDQAVSISSTAVRLSLPKVTRSVESLQSRGGKAKMPNDFTIDYVEVPNVADRDGKLSDMTPKVVQPSVDLKKYDQQMEYSLEIILGSLMSLNDIGQNEQTFFRDSAEAIRERSRQTLYTVEHIRKRERKIITSLLNKCVFFYNSVWLGKVESVEDFKTFGIQVHYDKFLSPSKEQKIKTYLPMYQSGAISVEKFVRTIYEDEMSEEDMQREIDYLEYQRSLARTSKFEGKEGENGEVNFKEAVRFVKTSSPYQDPIEKLSDNSGMNNHNRSVKDIKNI